MKAANKRRFTRAFPCPTCGGHDDMARGKGERCHGYQDERGVVHCGRKESPHPDREGGTWAHNLPARASDGPAAPVAPRRYFTYRDEAGAPLYRVGRVGDGPAKKIWQERSDGRGGWEGGRGARLVLYRLPELLSADPAATVYVVEGEPHADALAARGLVATCNPMGAGKWRDEYNGAVAGRNVVVLVDNDDPGRAHGESVAESVDGRAASIKVLSLPGLPPKGDVLDWFAAGGTGDHLDALAAAAPDWSAGAAPPAGPDVADEEEPEPVFKVERRADILNRPPVVFLAEDWIVAGSITMLYGPSNCGKSLIAWDLANRYEYGMAWGGGALSRGRAFYVYGEGGEGVRPRLESWEAETGAEARAAVVDVEEGTLQLHIPSTVDRFIGAVKELPAAERPSLVVLDTQATMTVGAEENATKEMTIALQSLKRIRRALNATILVIHHADKTGTAARGSSSLFAGYTTVLRADEVGEGRVRLRVEKQKDGRKGLEKFWALVEVGGTNSVALRESEAADSDRGQTGQPPAKLSDEDVMIVRAVEASWRGLTNQELAEELDMDRRRVSARGIKLRRAGQLTYDKQTRRYTRGHRAGDSENDGCPGADNGSTPDCPPCPDTPGQEARTNGQPVDMGLSGKLSVSAPPKGGGQEDNSGPVPDADKVEDL